ncbi:TIGR04104 family putative zinc finger protein [Salinicoccus sesuvii]|uniref:TIGR04104 family putative zinc finger protein n=1 Tax=Salinicoccus sesuvii TaxID=868281 RepID=UPI0036D2B4B8
MIRCSSCHESWNIRAVLKRCTTLSPGMECPSCGQMQYLSDRYRERSLMIMMLIPLLMLIPAFFDIPIMAMSILIFATFIVIGIIHIFTIELVSEADIGHQSFY